MPSERRLHPWTLLFSVAGQARQFAVPLVLALFVGSRGDNMEIWALPILVPYALSVVARFISFRYAFGDDELIIRSGLIFRNERHIPYARIQNLDAIQNAAHRLLGVVDARLDTGSGADVDARLSVVSWSAYEEVRRRVLAGRASESADPVVEAPARRPLVRLTWRDAAIVGLIENRAFVLLAAGTGVLWETGLLESFGNRVFGEGAVGQGAIRRFFIAWFRDGRVDWSDVAVGVAAVVAVLVVLRILSVVWAVVRLHGFRLDRIDDDLRTEYGLLTRVSATIPLRRVQTVTVSRGLVHTWFGRVTVRVETAGGQGPTGGSARRESLAPILCEADVAALLAEVLPEIDFSSTAWQPPAPRAFVRERRVRSVLALVVSGALTWLISWWAMLAGAGLLVWAWVSARIYVAHLRWAVVEGAVLFETGWIRHHRSIARFTKVQAVTWAQSPFDRRHGMARVSVDTAGAGEGSQRVDIPYLSLEAAAELHGRLAAAAGRTTFHW